MNEIIYLFLCQIAEAVYFSLFLIIGKNIKEKRLLFIGIMTLEYIMLTHFIKYNIWIQLLYTFMSFVNLKVLYKEKAQVTDIFLFACSSIVLIFISIISYFLIYFTFKEYIIALILNRVLMVLFLIIFKGKIQKYYKEFCKLWNRHKDKSKIRSLTLRNISIIIFNLMFWLINIGMILTMFLGERGVLNGN